MQDDSTSKLLLIFNEKKVLAVLGIFCLMPVYLGIAFLTGICFSPINHFAPIGSKYSGSGDLAEVRKTTTSVTGNII